MNFIISKSSILRKFLLKKILFQEHEMIFPFVHNIHATYFAYFIINIKNDDMLGPDVNFLFRCGVLGGGREPPVGHVTRE